MMFFLRGKIKTYFIQFCLIKLFVILQTIRQYKNYAKNSQIYKKIYPKAYGQKGRKYIYIYIQNKEKLWQNIKLS